LTIEMYFLGENSGAAGTKLEITSLGQTKETSSELPSIGSSRIRKLVPNLNTFTYRYPDG